MTEIDRDQILHVARLARLALTDEEVERLGGQLNDILAAVAKVSEPSAHGASPALTAAAEPPPEPPGTRVGSHGLCVGPYAEFSVDEPIANSSVLVLPSSVSPASLTRDATVESYTGT